MTTNGDGVDGNRNCWKSARDRNRLKARYSIRSRVLNSNDASSSASTADTTTATTTHSCLDSLCVEGKRKEALVKEDIVDFDENSYDFNDSSISRTMKVTKSTNEKKVGNHEKKVFDVNIDDNKEIQKKILIQNILLRIIECDRSYFSLQFMDENFVLLSNPVLVDYIWVDNDDDDHDHDHHHNNRKVLVGECRLLSWYLHEKLDQFKQFIQSIESFTFYEYSIWIGRYFITSALLLGGINPCIRGTFSINNGICIATTTNTSTANYNDTAVLSLTDHESDKPIRTTCDLVATETKLFDSIGSTVLQKFFAGVPLSLSSYIVKRVVEMRMAFILLHSRITVCENVCNNTKCCVCHQNVNVNQMLLFIDSPSYPLWMTDENTQDGLYNRQEVIKVSKHLFCEVCFWTDIVQNLDHRCESDVVINISDQNLVNKAQDPVEASIDINNEAIRSCAALRAQDSLAQFRRLPYSSKELKQSKQKKKKATEKEFVSKSWLQAVRTCIGTSQTVRMDKFLSHVTSSSVSSYHFVHCCLKDGVDVQKQNEYGQTALFIACWYGNIKIISLLLAYGADLFIVSYGGLSSLDVLIAAHSHENIFDGIIRQLQKYSSSLPVVVGTTTRSKVESDAIAREIDLIQHKWRTHGNQSLKAVQLIGLRSNHPGAGTWLVDNVFDVSTTNLIVEFIKRIPIAQKEQIKAKKSGKDVLCSVRSYFCDCTGLITWFIGNAIRQSILSAGDVKSNEFCVFPHIRFLCYNQPGSALAPHVDLCRVHPFRSGLRSTHSFLLYLTECKYGGETSLLSDLAGKERATPIALVKPECGRLLLFPHMCPHEGMPVISTPKIVIRGEVSM